MKEVEIYVGLTKDGKISDWSYPHTWGIKILADRGYNIIRLITVEERNDEDYAVFFGGLWQDVDLFHRRLRECSLWTGSDKITYGMDGWYVDCKDREDGSDFIDEDLHVALSQLVTLEQE